ncbi:MAG TPA: EAL domain-containing protein [Thermoanaerobaculia bacterium]|nr:EAL domain-containing protein [Thermoanaerobaculia bacterium]
MSGDRVARNALDRAMDEKEDLLLVYQPIHDARTRKIVAAEALLRQRRQTGEIREASIITKTAEKGPELFELNSMTVRQAFADAAKWMKKHSDIRLHLNLSPREFEEKDIVSRLKGLVADCKVDIEFVNLEITETSYIKKPEDTMKVLYDLKGLGLQLWLDDFGTGHSSITHLQHFPLDGLKLPGDFIAGVPHDVRCSAIVRSIIALAHDIGLAVVAEGVENEEQLQFLLAHKCDSIQGFLFSKPMPVEEFLVLSA